MASIPANLLTDRKTMSRSRRKTNISKRNLSLVVRLSKPNLLPSSRGRLRSRSLENEIAREMLRGPTDPNIDRAREINESSAVWAKINTPTDPEDPLGLGKKGTKAWRKTSTVRDMHQIDRDWRQAQASGAVKTQEDHKKWQLDHKDAIVDHVRCHRSFPAEMDGPTADLFPSRNPEIACQRLVGDYNEGYRFPGGFHIRSVEDGEALARPKVVEMFEMQSRALRRDLTDCGHAHGGMYAPLSPIVEQVGGEVFVGLGAQRFAVSGQDQYKYVRAEDVDWEEVMMNGGLGDMVVIEGSANEESLN